MDTGQPVGPGEVTRCVLAVLPVWAYGRGRPRPRLAIDVGKDAIWVIDLSTNALIASAWRAQVTATPANWTYRTIVGTHSAPLLVVPVPGLPPLFIGAYGRDVASWTWFGIFKYRFSWRGGVQELHRPAWGPQAPPPTYYVSGVDWFTLVEKFGLAPYLERHDG
jgi:hypothetical protein